MNIRIISTIFTMVYLIPFGLMIPGSVQATENSDYHVDIPFLDTDPPPLVLMVLGRDHKLYYEAYNDASDLDGDGTIDTRYRGEGEQYTDENNSGTYDLGEPYEDIDFNGVYSKGFDYYGYFDSYKCYKYDSTSVPARFYPTSKTHLNPITNAPTKKCGALDANTGEWVGEWSGDFLNYLTTTRMDALRKVLYGGYRAVDTVTETVLERVFIPQDSHTSGHEYHSLTADGYDIRDYTPYEAPKGATLRHLFASVTIDQNSNNYGYDDAPLLLTLANSPHRIWDWISSGTPTAINWGWIEYTPSSEEGYWQESITSHEEWDDVIATFANEEHGGASRFVDEVNQVSIADANPFLDDPDYEGYYIGDYYISVFTATLEVLPDEVWRGGGSGSTKYNAFTNRFRFLLFNDDNIEMIIEPLKDTGASITSTSYRGATIPTNNMPDDENATVVSLPDKWIMGSYDVASSGSGTFAYAELTPGKYNITFRYHELTGNESWYLLYDREIAFNDTATYDSNGDIDFSSSATISYYDFMTSDQDKYWRHLKYYSLPVVEGSAEEWSSSRTRITETTVLKPTTIESSGIAPTETDDTKTFYGFLQTFYGLKEYEPVESKVKTFEARVAVCYNEELKEDNCTQYANNYKPTGLLHSYGMSDKMYFGLLTGSYKKNTDGGVLRKNIGSFTNEVDKDTGQFLTPATGGIVETINKLRVYGYEYGPKNWDDPNAGAQPGDYSYADMGCSRISATMYSYGACVDWGNPVAEMMFEGMRYLAGQKTPHTFFKPADTLLNLPTPDWNDPYDPDDNGYQSCSKPYMLVISDTNPSYDSDELPGSPFALANTALPGFTAEFSANNNDLDVSTLSDTIYKNDAELQGKHFVGQTGASVSDNACSAKDIDSKLQIRGSCIENPGQQGSYYSAAIAYYGLKNDINKTAPGNQYVTTMAVALAAPLPEINIPMDNDKIITIVPFCKTLWGGTKYDDYLTTNYGNAKLNSTIVDFFVETLTSTYGKFRISYEDSEYGGDYDMDYIVTYEYQVDTVTNKVTITLTNEKISTFMVMHAGYFISGTTADGAYLEIRKNEDGIFTGSDAEEINFMLDTPEACTAPNTPVDCWKDFESDGTTPYPLPDDTHSRTFTPDTDGDAVTLLKNPLYFAAKWGGFNDTDTPLTDSDSDGELEYSADPIPNLKSEWDQDDDGDPDNYFYVTNPGNMKEQLDKAFSAIENRTASATSAAVITSSRSGEGAVYQSVFYPGYKDNEGNTISWVGDVHGLFVDEYGNMREDTDQDHQLDVEAEYDANEDGILDAIEDKNNDGNWDFGRDYILQWDDNGNLFKYDDVNEDGIVQPSEKVSTGVEDINNIRYLWAAQQWLNSPDLNPTEQRDYLTLAAGTNHKRYIVTFIDGDGDDLVDSGEQADFTDNNKTDLLPYLTLYPNFGDLPQWVKDIKDLGTTEYESLNSLQAERLINYVRGEEQVETEIDGKYVPEMRSRTYKDDNDNQIEKVWRLGDIIHSSPKVIGRPAENFHLLYNDTSYSDFYIRYRKRRSVVYVGGNDGMLHAFNAGFFNGDDNEILETIGETYDDVNGNHQYDTGETYDDWNGNSIHDDTVAQPLGAELWAYAPYNLLPHLYWLTEKDYKHVYYLDGQTRVFDARIFFQGDGTTELDEHHPNGWGTVLVVGMGLGGGLITTDIDRDNLVDLATDKQMTSAYVVVDITNPEQPPRIMAELTIDKQGFATDFPTVLAMNDISTNTNQWYLILGSGPAASDGKTTTAAEVAMSESKSLQTAKLFILDLNSIGKGSYDPLLDLYEKDLTTITNSYVSSPPAAADFDLDYTGDAVYFGVSSYDNSEWGSSIHRLLPDGDPIGWNINKLIDLSIVPGKQPITGKVNIGTGTKAWYDSDGDADKTLDKAVTNRWIFFGTGRYVTYADRDVTDTQSYYGIKEPVKTTYPDGGFTWGEVDQSDLANVTDVKVYTDGSVRDYPITGDLTTWNDFVIDIDTKAGWYRNFPARERNLSQAALMGETLTFSTYEPLDDQCKREGYGYLYALYYRTGTAYFDPFIGWEHDDLNDDDVVDDNEEKSIPRIKIGPGVPAPPSIHVGKDGKLQALTQGSDGGINSKEEGSKSPLKSGKSSWMQREE